MHVVKTLDATEGPRTGWGLLFRAWAVLVESARARRTITYGELANRIMLPGDVRSIGPMVLHPVYVHFCAPNGFPDILSLVVRKDTGRPGIGYYSAGGGTGGRGAVAVRARGDLCVPMACRAARRSMRQLLAGRGGPRPSGWR